MPAAKNALATRGMSCQITGTIPGWVPVTIPLNEIVPRLNSESASELLIRLCECYNRGKTQKKLGDCTPQDFLEALRRMD